MIYKILIIRRGFGHEKTAAPMISHKNDCSQQIVLFSPAVRLPWSMAALPSVKPGASLQRPRKLRKTFLVRRTEPVYLRTIDIEDTDQPAGLIMQRNHNLRIAGAVAGNMSRKLMNVFDALNLIQRCSSSADTFPKWNPDTGRLPLKRPENQLIITPQIEPCPVQPGQLRIQKRRGIREHRQKPAVTFRKTFQLFTQNFIICHRKTSHVAVPRIAISLYCRTRSTAKYAARSSIGARCRVNPLRPLLQIQLPIQAQPGHKPVNSGKHRAVYAGTHHERREPGAVSNSRGAGQHDIDFRAGARKSHRQERVDYTEQNECADRPQKPVLIRAGA